MTSKKIGNVDFLEDSILSEPTVESGKEKVAEGKPGSKGAGILEGCG
jgi:hypothetical protein